MKTVFIFVFLFCAALANAQYRNTGYIYSGFAAGQETFIAPPKFGGVVFHDFKKHKGCRKDEKPPVFACYAGGDGSIGLLYALWFSASIHSGIKAGPLSIEGSVAGFYIPKVVSGEARGHFTFNPKVGLQVWKLWFKAGPSILLNGSRALPNEYMRINGIHYNFEIDFFVGGD